MNEQIWQLYECIYDRSMPICSNQLIDNFVTVDLAKSEFPTKIWNQIGNVLQTEPEAVEINSAKLKYYSIRPQYEDILC